MLQVAEVQTPTAAFCLAVVPVKTLYQLHQASGTGSGLGQTFQDFAGFIPEGPKFLFQTVLAGISGSFDPFCQFLIHILPGESKPSVVDIPIPDNIIPTLGRPEIFQLTQGGPQGQSDLFHTKAALCILCAFPDHRDLGIQIGEQVFHQKSAPEGFGSIRKFLHFRRIQAAFQPLLRIQVAAGAVVDLFHNIRHQMVIPSQSLGVHKGPEISVAFFFIHTVQHILQHRFPQFPALVFISHTEIRGNIQTVGILPEQVTAETVDCGNLCQKQPLHLLLQMAVFRFQRDAFRKLGGNFAAKL